jgi:hypothetical protein
MLYNKYMSHKSDVNITPTPKIIELVDEHVGLDEDEQVVLLLRKHWHIFRNSLFVGLFIPFVLLSIMGIIYLGGPVWSANTMRLLWAGVIALSSLAFLVGFARFLWHYHMWKHTFYVMTTKKLAIINRYRPFSYEAQQISLSNINDITIRQEGVQAFLYQYSDVIAITFSGSTFVFSEVGHAAQVQKAIMQQLAKQDRPHFLQSDSQ